MAITFCIVSAVWVCIPVCACWCERAVRTRVVCTVEKSKLVTLKWKRRYRVATMARRQRIILTEALATAWRFWGSCIKDGVATKPVVSFAVAAGAIATNDCKQHAVARSEQAVCCCLFLSNSHLSQQTAYFSSSPVPSPLCLSFLPCCSKTFWSGSGTQQCLFPIAIANLLRPFLSTVFRILYSHYTLPQRMTQYQPQS